MKRLLSHVFWVSLVLSLIFGIPSLSSSKVVAQSAASYAVARLQDASGNAVGSVSFIQVQNKVSILAQVNGLPPGFHGFHVHAVGQCDASSQPPFSSAGAHHDAAGAAHANHAGDLPVMMVLADGTGFLSAVTDRFTVADLLDADGSAVIVHANPDNYANIPERYGVAVDEETTGTGDAGGRIACGVVESPSFETAEANNLASIQALPLDLLPASVSRGENAEAGTLVLTVPALGGIQVVGQISSGAAGQIGEAHREGDTLVFTFTEITYDVAPMALPDGTAIGPQSIRLDPTQPSTLTVDLITGVISRNFHWILTATDVLYDGQPSIGLGDTARAQVVETQNVGENQFSLRLMTHWSSNITLQTWTIGGVTLPSGEIQATAEFDGTYVLDFSQ